MMFEVVLITFCRAFWELPSISGCEAASEDTLSGKTVDVVESHLIHAKPPSVCQERKGTDLQRSLLSAASLYLLSAASCQLNF